MIAHNKPICKELFEDICSNVNVLEIRFEQSEQILNRKIKSNEEILRIKFYDEQMDRFYLENCNLEELPDEQELVEKVTDHDQIIELYDTFEEYGREFSSYIEEINAVLSEIFDYIDFDNIEDAKEKLAILNEVLHYDDRNERNKFERYIEVMNNTEGLESIKEDFKNIIEYMIHEFEDIVRQISYDDIRDFQEGIITKLVDAKGNNLQIDVVGWFWPEKGSSDTVYIIVKYKDREKVSGIIEKSYGDYEILDDTYSVPIHSEELSINIKDVIGYLEDFKSDNCAIFEALCDQLYTIISL